MKNITFITNTALLVLASVLILGLFLVHPTNLSAQTISPEQRCYNKKLRATGAHVNCLLRAEARANRNPNVDLQAAKNLCDERFETRFNRAEAQAAAQGATCPSQGNMSPTDQNNTTATSTGNTVSEVKTLNIEISQDDLENLRLETFNLNIAVQVNGTSSVVWRSVSDYDHENQFQWSQVFHIFGTDEIEESEAVNIDTNVVNIALGQDVVLDSTDLLDQPVAGSAANSITFINYSGSPVFPALSQQLSATGSTQAITPIFVSEVPLQNTQSLVITPTQQVIVWFGDPVQTGALITETITNTEFVDLTNDSSATRLFSNMQWSTPSP